MQESALAEPPVLLERESEVGSVRAALRAAGRGAGGVLVVEGAAGMGKSRLLEEAGVRASELGVRVLNARATELEQGFPFGVVRQLFERALLQAEPGERDRWLSGAAALAAEVVTGAPATGSTTSAGPSAGDPGYAWHHGLYWLASNLAADSPLTLVVDDMQWCDGPSARALAFIARRLEGQALALILATRPLDPALMPDAATLVADPAVELMRPAPLTRDAIRSLVAARISGEPHDRFIDACAEVTGGNPFLLGELLDEAAARDLAPSAVAAAEVGEIVPRGVANAVLLRLARLPSAAAALARALSALGDGAQLGDASWNPPAPSSSPIRSCARRSTATSRRPNASGSTRPPRGSCASGERPPFKSQLTSCIPSRPPRPRRWLCYGTPPATHWPWVMQQGRPPFSLARSTSLPLRVTGPRSCSSSGWRLLAPARRKRSNR
jgi:AAA ATPase domain